MKNSQTPKAILAWPTLGLALVALAGCFDSGGGSSSSKKTEQGVFIDSPVSGLSYSAGSSTAKTDAQGRFNYRPEQVLSFSVGGLKLGEARAKSRPSPVDLVANGTLADTQVINIARLLQGLDKDGNLYNGIEISPAIDQAISAFAKANGLTAIDFTDQDGFEELATALLAELNSQNLFDENAKAGQRVLREHLAAWQHLNNSLAQAEGATLKTDVLPVLFIHGGAGSASQFESQTQRFIANGYPAEFIAAYEYDSGVLAADPLNLELAAQRHKELNALIDRLLQTTGAKQINLLGHSLGTMVSQMYLAVPANAAKVAHYVNIDGRGADAQPGGVPTLAIWGQYVTEKVEGAENIYPPEDDPVAHIEAATSGESFKHIYRFFNDQAPQTHKVPQSQANQVWLAGKAALFPENKGASGTTLQVYEVDSATGARLSDSALYSKSIGEDGAWGPFAVDKGASIEYALIHGDNQDQYFYREPYVQDSFMVRLNTSRPGTGVGRLLQRASTHTNLMIGRDMELWGDQDANNDSLTVNGQEMISDLVAPLLTRLSVLFINDRGADQKSNLAVLDPYFASLPFMRGLDYYLPASANGSGSIEVRLQSRRGGQAQVINVPNWPSSQVRSVSLQFKDYSDE